MKITGLIILVLLLLVPSIGCVNTSSPAGSTTNLITSITNVFTSDSQLQLNKTSWSLKAFGDGGIMTPLLPGPAITLRFGNNSTYYHGSIGTFSYGGQMSEHGNNLIIGLMTSTPITIPDNPPGFLQQATDYFALIRKVETYAINNGELVINCGNGKSLIFFEIENPPSNP